MGSLPGPLTQRVDQSSLFSPRERSSVPSKGRFPCVIMSESGDTRTDPNSPQHDAEESQGLPESGKSNAEDDVKVDLLDTPVKSESDKKDYRVIKLPNGLTAVLISDVKSLRGDEINDDDDENKDNEIGEQDSKENVATSGLTDQNVDSAEKKLLRKEEKMAACGLSIGVGSFSDPTEIPGLSHFLEHMVFMGSEKYPEENDFHVFIEKHGGYANACTDIERTAFYFQIPEKKLLAALDRLAQFFISPLLRRDAMTREREAVDSEFQLVRTDDFCRGFQIFSSLVKPGHPVTKFVWGNLVTLRDNVEDDKLYEELRKFRKRHYSAHRMTLAIQARMPMDTLEQYVKGCFASVENNELPPDDFTEFKGPEPFDTPNFRRIYKLKPVGDVCEVTLTWVMPPLNHLYKCKPQSYVSRVIGHEGKGSLISYLRKKMWCLDDNCYAQQSSIYTLFYLTLVLTEDGHKHLKDVLDAVFSYITMIRGSGPQQRIHDEISQINETNFKFQDENAAVIHVESLAIDMQLYPPKDYLTGSVLQPEYDPTEIEACMDALTPDGVNILISNKKYNEAEFEKVEPWFNTKYTDTEIPKDWIAQWKEIEPFEEFHLLEPNIFITDDFDLVPLPEDVPEYPTKIHSDAMSEVWFRPDPKFKKPECYMDYYFMSPLPLASPQNSASLDLMVLVLQQLLAEDLYPASCAKLNSDCSAHGEGIIVTVSGYSQKLPILLATIVRRIADCRELISENMFNVLKAQQRKAYYNTFIYPGGLEGDVESSILTLVHWQAIQKYGAISDLDFEQFETFVARFVDHIYLKCLVQGNIAKEDVIKNTQNCLDILKCRSILPNTLSEPRATQLPLGVRCCRVKNFNKTDNNSMVTNYYQSGIASIETLAIIDLIIMLMREPLFNQLRTQEQLAYAVYCTMQNSHGVCGYSIIVCTQADKFSTEYIDDRIEAFVTSFKDTLDKLSEEELKTVKIALVKQKQCTDLNLPEEHNRNWDEILGKEYMFDRRDREIKAINSTTLADLKDWMEKHVSGGTNMRKLSIQIVGNPETKDEVENKSSGGTETVENSDESTETSATCVNGNTDSNNSVEANSDEVSYQLEYLSDMPDEKTIKSFDYFITDVQRFKNSLYVYPTYAFPQH